MSEHLDKAKGALDQAGFNLRSKEYDPDDKRCVRVVHDLLDVAAVQAAVAQAEAMVSIADSLRKMAASPAPWAPPTPQPPAMPDWPTSPPFIISSVDDESGVQFPERIR